MRTALLISSLLALAACPGSGTFVDDFTEACAASSNIDRPVCECMARKAETDLSDTERQFVLATLQEDEDRAAELRTELGFQGAMRAGMFMTNITECALAGGGR